MSTKKLIKALGLIIVVALLAAALPLQAQAEGATVIPVYVLSPSWDAEGGGGVFSAYVAPPDYGYVSPGSTGLYQGREAGIIKAGLAPDPEDSHYWDEGLFGFIPNVSIETLAAGPLTYDVIVQAGVNPVWMTIELDTGSVGDRSDNTTYQFVPTSNPAEWHTVDAKAGQWQKWNNNNGDTSGSPLITLSQVATAHPGVNVVRVYLRLGMGDSYNNGGTGTINWVDSATICTNVYDFQVKDWYVAPGGDDDNLGTLDSPFLTIQHAIDVSSDGDTIHVAAGTYLEIGQIVINKNISIVGADKATTIIKPAQNTGTSGDARGWWLVQAGVEFNLSNVTLDGAEKLLNMGILSHGTGTIENNIIKNIGYNPSGPDYAGRGIAFYDANMTIKNNLFQNIGRIGIYVYGAGASQAVIDGNTYEGKGVGNWLDYGIEIEGGAVVEVKNNLIKNCLGIATVDGSGSAGLLITTYFAPGSTANIHNNEFNGNDVAIYVGYNATDVSSVVAQYNKLVGNDTAIYTKNPEVNGSPNWWGCNAGPGNTGCDNVSENVDYDPWLILKITSEKQIVKPNETIQIDANLIYNSAGENTLSEGYVPDGIEAEFVVQHGDEEDFLASETTVKGQVSTTFTPTEGGVFKICVTVDNQTVCTEDIVVPAAAAVADAYRMIFNSTLDVDIAEGVTKNDTGITEGFGYTVSLVSGPTHGQLQLKTDGSFKYIPEADFVGDDSFVYQLVIFPSEPAIANENPWMDQATVTISVEAYQIFIPLVLN